MKKTKIILIFLILIVFSTYGNFDNKNHISKMESRLENSSGKERINILKELSYLNEYENLQKSIIYTKEVIMLSSEFQEIQADSYEHLANIYKKIDNYNLALKNQNKSLKLRVELQNENKTANSYFQLAIIHKAINNKKEALSNYSKALEIRKKNKNKSEIASIYNSMGNLFWKSNDYGNAIEYYLKALEIRDNLGNNISISASLSNLGNVYKTLKRYNKALDYYIKSLKLREKSNNKELIAYSLNDIGGVYWRMNNLNEALNYYTKALSIREKLNNKLYTASSLKNIGVVYKDLNEFELSLEHYNKALQIYSMLKKDKEQALIYSYIGNLFRSYNKYEKSLEYYKIAYVLNQDIGNIEGSAFNSNSIAEIMLEQNNSLDAESYFLDAFQLAQTGNNRQLNQTIAQNLFEYYSDEGQYKEALKYYRNVSKIQFDSISDIKKTYKINEFEAQYLIAQNKDEISSLKLSNSVLYILIIIFSIILIIALILSYIFYKNVLYRQSITKILAQKNSKLEDINSRLKETELILKDLNLSKDKVFSIISKDLKSIFKELEYISSELYADFENFNSEQKYIFTKDIMRLSKDANTMVDNLLNWAASRSGKTKFKAEYFNIEELISKIKLKDIIEEKNIKLNLNIDSETNAYADISAISEVFKHLINNAVKFSYPNGKITISSKEKKYLVEIEISDEGMGISKENLEKIFQLDNDYINHGTSSKKGAGLGLLLCHEYVNKNGGKIWAQTIETGGTAFIFTIPKSDALKQN